MPEISVLGHTGGATRGRRGRASDAEVVLVSWLVEVAPEVVMAEVELAPEVLVAAEAVVPPLVVVVVPPVVVVVVGRECSRSPRTPCA